MSTCWFKGDRPNRSVGLPALLNVTQKTAVSWESGTRKPSGAALKLLQLVKQRPEILAGT